MSHLFLNVRRQLFCNTTEPLLPAVDHEVLGPMMPAPTNNTATPVLTQENLVLVLTANHEDPDFWRYLQANFHVEFEFKQNPTLDSGFGVNVVPPWSNEIGYVKHGSRGKQPCISGDTEKLMTSGKQPSISGDTVKIISSFFPGDSYRFDPIEICNVVHFDFDSDCTSTARTRHPQKRYKAV
ncbi:hypothetical protein C1H46_008867 [Malus baccata]|uniref:Uncharacterized protein n=1 Tax=Malus baccata TaxID=106549 RepID=A0A540N3B2_MALBA|nr:hypothetical protein C1H46_008867 [Malus baccata]